MTTTFLKRNDEKVMVVDVDHEFKVITMSDIFTKKQIVKGIRILKIMFPNYCIR